MSALAADELARDESLQYALRNAHWHEPKPSKALGVALSMQAVLIDLSTPAERPKPNNGE